MLRKQLDPYHYYIYSPLADCSLSLSSSTSALCLRKFPLARNFAFFSCCSFSERRGFVLNIISTNNQDNHTHFTTMLRKQLHPYHYRVYLPLADCSSSLSSSTSALCFRKFPFARNFAFFSCCSFSERRGIVLNTINTNNQEVFGITAVFKVSVISKDMPCN